MESPHPPPRVDPRIAEALIDSPSSFSFEELAALSSHRAARTAIVTGHAVRLLPNSYVGACHAQSFAARASATLRWLGDDALLSGAAALFAWDALGEAPDRIAVAVGSSRRPRAPDWIRVTRTDVGMPSVMRRRLRVVPLAHALVLGYAELPRDVAEDAMYRAVQQRRLSPQTLKGALEAMPRVARRREIERLVDALSAGAHSHLERVALMDVFRGRPFSDLLRQHTLVVEGRRCELDMYDAATRTAMETDGAAYHANPEAHQSDAERDVLVATLGIQTLRFTYRDIVERPDWCQAMAAAVLRVRATQQGLGRP
ncbi:hypothetical protein [Demequina sp. NBRC 110054]|uniref:hypothetical protein n=1 Tax=Demequina sp. NBRC 110054 TaxID=1570343 RepID=UPI001177C0E1|nr:hypothetical protein [Demequina sp. NBRC 110054]